MIVDASVALKWVITEDGSDRALALLDGRSLIAPDLIAPELANAVWKKWRRGELMAVPDELADILDVFESVMPVARLIDRATAIAVALQHPAYDCFYLALSENLDRSVLTADRRFLNRIAGTRFADLAVDFDGDGWQ